jgi:hypothetical protein
VGGGPGWAAPQGGGACTEASGGGGRGANSRHGHVCRPPALPPAGGRLSPPGRATGVHGYDPRSSLRVLPPRERGRNAILNGSFAK